MEIRNLIIIEIVFFTTVNLYLIHSSELKK